MKRFTLLALAAAFAGITGAASAETTLTVYTALEADQIKAYQAAFEKANPDIKIQWVRDSTAVSYTHLDVYKRQVRRVDGGAWRDAADPGGGL